jgi:enoyl-CoA hydratase/carnithine racemase
MAKPRVQVEIGEHVATVTLNRPDKHNALDAAMFDGIRAATERLQEQPEVRVVVLRGAGPSFCSGIDVAAMVATDAERAGVAVPLHEPVPNRFQQAVCGWMQLPVPVIAAIHGNCLGGGLQIALGADIRIAAPDARLAVMEGRWGLIPDMAITRTLPRLVGIDVAKELTYTARVMSGEEAARLGIVTRCATDPLAAARALAAEIAGRSPDAVRAAKRLYDEAWSAPAEATLALEATLQEQLIGLPNQLAAATAAFTGQPPEFVDPPRESSGSGVGRAPETS